MARLLSHADMAEVIFKAANDPRPIDVEAAAGWLFEADIYAGIAREEIANVLLEGGGEERAQRFWSPAF